MFRVRRLWWLIAGVGSIALLSVYFVNSNGKGATANGSPIQVVEADASMEHIHNLILTDSGLLLGTHQGLWLQHGMGSSVRMGTSHFDVMGLALAPNGIVASGHPGAGEEQVNDLGLRASRDQGRTWNNISLFGKVDFHRLVASGIAVMGISAHDGGLLRSEDSGKTWQALPNPNLFDLAMDPTDPSMIVGTTQTGLVRSIDGGKTFSAIQGAPLLALLSWDKTHLVGVTPQGALFESVDMGLNWRKLATVNGEPGALSVRGNEIALLAGSTVFYSGDGGATFRPRIIGVMGH